MIDYEDLILARDELDSDYDDCAHCPLNPWRTGKDCWNSKQGCCECEVIEEHYNPNIPISWYT